VSARGLALGLAAVALAAPAPASRAADEEPFEILALQVPGRPVEAFAAGEGLARPRLVVASVAGAPPDEERWISIFPPLPASGARPGPAVRIEVGPEVAAFDVGDVHPGGSPEIALLSARELALVPPGGEPQRIALATPLPLPPRTRELSRLRFLRDWTGEGRLSALLPSLDGALLVSFADARQRTLAFPVLSEYVTAEPPDPVSEGYAAVELVWPDLEQADDDGDGRPDVFALTRFHVFVFRAGSRGLAPRPARRARMPAFPWEAERQPEVNALRAFASDLDGDGRADLVVHRTEGNLLDSRTTTDVHANDGRGASPETPPAATLETRGGLGAVRLVDLDGDGRRELVQTFVPFDVLQLVRVLVRRRVEATLRVLRFEGSGLGHLVPSWETQLGYPLDFAAGRIVGLLPTLDGDWNGDGHRDLLHGEKQGIAIRLGRSQSAGPGFGPVAARQTLGSAERSAVADLDGDGLDDLVFWDPLDLEGRVHVARNRGVLPGSPPRVRAAEPGADPATRAPRPEPGR
jgi:hypothetical protein